MRDRLLSVCGVIESARGQGGALTASSRVIWRHMHALWLTAVFSLLLLPGFSMAAGAAAWKPDRAVTLVVPYNPGGGTDAVARAVAIHLSKIWGQSVVVANVAGADGLIGTRRVIASKPDGLTLLVTQNGVLVTKYIPSLKGEDPLSSLEPVVLLADSPNVLVVKKSIVAKDFPGLFKHCAGTPCSYGAVSPSGRLSGFTMQSDSIPNLNMVSYAGSGGPVVTDLVAGNLDMAVLGSTAAIGLHNEGKFRILATLGNKRTAELPEIPTSREAGFPALYSVSWFGMFAPKGTPADVLNGIAKAVNESLADPAVLKALRTASTQPVGGSPADFAKHLLDEDRRIAPLAQKLQ